MIAALHQECFREKVTCWGIIAQLHTHSDIDNITISFREWIHQCYGIWLGENPRGLSSFGCNRLFWSVSAANYTMLDSYFERLCTPLSLVRSAGKIPPSVNYGLVCAGTMSLNQRCARVIYVESESQALRVRDIQIFSSRVITWSSHKNCRVVSSHWFASSSRVNVESNEMFTYFLWLFFDRIWRPTRYKMAHHYLKIGAQCCSTVLIPGYFI